jgi:hypothetical protein
MSRSEMNQALRRSIDYHYLPPDQQWAQDKALGILDWSPSRKESDEYRRLRARMGDPAFKDKETE